MTSKTNSGVKVCTTGGVFLYKNATSWHLDNGHLHVYDSADGDRPSRTLATYRPERWYNVQLVSEAEPFTE